MKYLLILLLLTSCASPRPNCPSFEVDGQKRLVYMKDGNGQVNKIMDLDKFLKLNKRTK